MIGLYILLAACLFIVGMTLTIVVMDPFIRWTLEQHAKFAAMLSRRTQQ